MPPGVFEAPESDSLWTIVQSLWTTGWFPPGVSSHWRQPDDKRPPTLGGNLPTVSVAWITAVGLSSSEKRRWIRIHPGGWEDFSWLKGRRE